MHRRHCLSALSALASLGLRCPTAHAASAPPGDVTEPAAGSVQQPWPPGKRVPALDLGDLAGRHWSLRGLRGKVVLLNFWATWCEPCVEEIPALDQLARTHGPRGLQVLAINYQQSAQAIQAFLQKNAMETAMPILLDADGQAARAWIGRIFPTSVLVGRDGRPRVQIVGGYDWASAGAGRLLQSVL